MKQDTLAEIARLRERFESLPIVACAETRRRIAKRILSLENER